MTDNIHAAINAVMGEVGYVQKERKQGLNYSFASEKALIEALRPEMVKNGIYMHVSFLDKPVTHSYETKGGSLMNHTLLSGIVRFTHAHSDTHIEAAAIGEGADTGDKSANKAMTALYKYALRQTFCIETGDDPDNSPSSEQERKPRDKYGVPPVDVPDWVEGFNRDRKRLGVTADEIAAIIGGSGTITNIEKWIAGDETRTPSGLLSLAVNNKAEKGTK